MSGLALVMKGLGFKIQGSDKSLNKNIERLKKNKIKVSIKHSKKNDWLEYKVRLEMEGSGNKR